MKQILVILFTCFYSLLSLGFSLNVHFCEYRIVNITLAHYSFTKGCEVVDDKVHLCTYSTQYEFPVLQKKACCSDQPISLNITEDEFPTDSSFLSFDFYPQQFSNYHDTEEKFVFVRNKRRGVYNLPPPRKEAFYILYQHLLFYS